MQKSKEEGVAYVLTAEWHSTVVIIFKMHRVPSLPANHPANQYREGDEHFGLVQLHVWAVLAAAALAMATQGQTDVPTS